MNLNLKTPQDPNKTDNEKMIRNLTDCYMVMQRQLLNLLDGMLDTNNVREISASKITAGTIKALIEIISPLITGGTITGGTIRTAATGKRVEISENQIKCYNTDNKLNGFCIDKSDVQYGDVSFYSNGTKLFTIYNALEGTSLKPETGKALSIGASECNTNFAGTINIPIANIDNMALTTQTAPTAETGKIKLYYDGTALKARLPDGTIKTVTMT